VATEPVAVFLFVSGVWCLVRATGLESMGGRGWVAGAAMAFSGLHLARPEGMFVLLAAAIAGAVLFYRRDGRLRRFAVTFGAVAAVGIAVNTAYVQVVADVWTVNYRVGFIGEQPEGSTVLRELARTLRGMAVDVPAVMLGPLLWLFVGIGLVQAGRDVRHVRAEVTVLFFAAVQWLVVLPVLSPSPRYLMSALVLVMLWCGRGISETGRLLGAHVSVRGGRWAPAAAALLFFAGHLAFAIAGQRFGEGSLRPPREYKVAGQWMGEHLEHGTILTRKPQVAYYAGMPSIGPALDASLEEIVAMGEAGVYRYLVVDERYSARMAPSLHGLLDPETAPETLRLIRDDLSPYPDARVVVYEVAVR